MTGHDQHSPGPQLELATTGTGGRSARVAALAIGVVLVSIVYLGTTGSGSESPAASVQPASAEPAAVAAVPTPAAAVPTPTATALPDATARLSPSLATPSPIGTQATAPTFPNEAYELALRAGKRSVHAPMQVLQPGIVSSLLLVPESSGGDTISLDISARPQADPLRAPVPVSSFEMVVPQRAKLQGPEQALDAIVLGSPSSSGIIGIESNGYRVTATYLVIGETRAINVVLFVNANPQPSPELGRRWVTGDDGLVGWPSALSR